MNGSDAPEGELEPLARLLESWGCPSRQSLMMAGQLDKRARQLSEQKGRPYEEAMSHLLRVVQEGRSGHQS